MKTIVSAMFYISAITIDGMTRTTSHFGTLADAHAILNQWLAYGYDEESGDPHILFAAIVEAGTGAIVRIVNKSTSVDVCEHGYAFDCRACNPDR